MTRLRGRARRGERLVGAVPHGHWKTSTFIGALRCDGLTAPGVFDGAINGELFLAYVEQILVPTLKPGDVVRWTPLAGQLGGLVKLGSGCRQAANFSVPVAL
jgi:hypothetical protein